MHVCGRLGNVSFFTDNCYNFDMHSENHFVLWHQFVLVSVITYLVPLNLLFTQYAIFSRPSMNADVTKVTRPKFHDNRYHSTSVRDWILRYKHDTACKYPGDQWRATVCILRFLLIVIHHNNQINGTRTKKENLALKFGLIKVTFWQKTKVESILRGFNLEILVYTETGLNPPNHHKTSRKVIEPQSFAWPWTKELENSSLIGLAKRHKSE